MAKLNRDKFDIIYSSFLVFSLRYFFYAIPVLLYFLFSVLFFGNLNGKALLALFEYLVRDEVEEAFFVLDGFD